MTVSSNNLDVSQRIEFSCCYLYNDQFCPTLQSHTYKFEATVHCYSDYYNNIGVVFPFHDFKELCKEVVPNGCYIYNTNFDTFGVSYSNDEKEKQVYRSLVDIGVTCVGFPFTISIERLLNEISSKLDIILNCKYPGLYLVETKLRENANSLAIWKNTERKSNANTNN